jgi:hypothetical protein
MKDKSSIDERRSPDISRILAEYPELGKYSGQELAWTISAIHSNNRTVAHFIEDARSGTFTGSVEHLNGFVGNMLAELPKDNALTRFAADEAELHRKNLEEAAQAVGDKVRGSDGMYRKPGYLSALTEGGAKELKDRKGSGDLPPM